MYDFFNQYFPIIIAAIIGLISGVLTYFRYRGKTLDQIKIMLQEDAFEIFKKADKFLVGADGPEKFEWANAQFMGMIPKAAGPLFKNQTIRHYLQQLYYLWRGDPIVEDKPISGNENTTEVEPDKLPDNPEPTKAMGEAINTVVNLEPKVLAENDEDEQLEYVIHAPKVPPEEVQKSYENTVLDPRD
jgi:hypothetical protein